MNINNYDNNKIIDLLYKQRFQNNKVNRLLSAYEKGAAQVTFDGKTIKCTSAFKGTITVDLDKLNNSKKWTTLSRRIHDLKGKKYKEDYHRRISQLVFLSGAFDTGESRVDKNLDSQLIFKKHPELQVRSFGIQTPLAVRYPTDQIIFIHGAERIVLDIPKSGKRLDQLNQYCKVSGIDDHGFSNLRKSLLDLTLEIAQGNLNGECRGKIKHLQNQIEKLNLVAWDHYENYGPTAPQFILDNCLKLLKYELEIVSEVETELQKLFNKELSKPYFSCSVHPEQPTFNIKFNEDVSMPFDREGLKQHILLFQDEGFEVPEDDLLDLSKFELIKEDVDLLSLYLNENLEVKDLDSLSEERLFKLFDFALLNGIPRLEALLGKEITQRVLNIPWEDEEGITHDRNWEDKTVLQKWASVDALRPLVAFISA